MTDVRPEDLGETPSLEVRAYRNGELVRTARCDSEEEVAAIIEQWTEEADDLWCEILDLTDPKPSTELIDRVLPAELDEDYPPAVEPEVDEGSW